MLSPKLVLFTSAIMPFLFFAGNNSKIFSANHLKIKELTTNYLYFHGFRSFNLGFIFIDSIKTYKSVEILTF
jgi:hypothetical protein